MDRLGGCDSPGTSIQEDKDKLRDGQHLVVGTPGRGTPRGRYEVLFGVKIDITYYVASKGDGS